ncbi:Tat pathway signal protein [Methyloligella sp. 2.7D]|uniref:Tat pathway signal sequence domain protein n=1 Tax=unclassified Methyloligella TaxID=2625955 RepID=UPI00157C054A|nr:Tat pathway signal sequence domain protein [Methyloligella sp. GL2]QKP77335.1 Tat pathway signal sequence domain protein [Methyloligella sp. GL2]
MRLAAALFATLLLLSGSALAQTDDSTTSAPSTESAASAETAPAADETSDADAASDLDLTVELNKLEPQQNACRTYVLFQNKGESAFSSLKFDIVAFDKDGIVAKRLAVEAAPLSAAKTQLKVFDIAEISCDKLGKLLLNDITACKDQNGDIEDCVSKITLTSKSDVPFEK